MKNWTVDTKILAKNPEQYKIWQLEQLINFGLDGKKLKHQDLKNYLPRLKIDPAKKKYLNFLIQAK